MAKTVCTKEQHDALKQSPLWDLCERIGLQVTPEDEYGPEEICDLRNCQCGSTLAKRIK